MPVLASRSTVGRSARVAVRTWLQLFVLCVLCVAFVPGLARIASAQDAAPKDLDERIERVKRLSPPERQRLKAALRRFKELPEDRRRELREKASRVGEDRLRGLKGRDIRGLSRRHQDLQRERQAVLEILQFEQRTADLSAAEKELLRVEAGRQFHQFVRREILAPGHSPLPKDFDRLPHEQRRERVRAGMQALMKRLEEQMTPQEREEFVRLEGAALHERRMELLREFRVRMAGDFARNFDNAYLTPFLQASAEQRAALVEKFQRRTRWFEVASVLEREVGVSRETLLLLRALDASDWAQIRLDLERTASMPPLERRAEMERGIRELYGRAAADVKGGLHRRPRGGDGPDGRRPRRRGDDR